MNKSSNTGRRGIKLEIMNLHSLGFNYTEIQKKLNCSKGTVSHHLSKFIQEERKIKKEKKEELIDSIKKNVPKSKDEFDKICLGKLNSKEINFFHTKFYKEVKPSLGTKKNDIPKEYYRNKRYKIKKDLVDYKGGKCEICGYNKSLRALQFHHKNPKEKDFNIGGCTTLNELVKKELEKCILVCANCHSEIHDNNVCSDARVVE